MLRDRAMDGCQREQEKEKDKRGRTSMEKHNVRKNVPTICKKSVQAPILQKYKISCGASFKTSTPPSSVRLRLYIHYKRTYSRRRPQ